MSTPSLQRHKFASDYSQGSSPYWLVPCSDSRHAKTMFAIGMMRHQPDLPVSCIRRTPTAIDGNNSAKVTNVLSVSPIKPQTKPRIKVKSQNHQYSDLDALPLKLTYLLKHVEIDCPNVITLLIKKLRSSNIFILLLSLLAELPQTNR